MSRDDFPDPYKKVRWRGGKCDNIDKVAIQVWEERMAATATIYQLGYNPGGVAASAGAHDGGGVVDCWFPTLANIRAVKRGRDVLGVGWLRHPPTFPYHHHMIRRASKTLAPVAARQVPLFDAGGNGLVGNAPDEIGYRPDPPATFGLDDYYTELRARKAERRKRKALKRISRDIKHLFRRKRKIRRQLRKLNEH